MTTLGEPNRLNSRKHRSSMNEEINARKRPVLQCALIPPLKGKFNPASGTRTQGIYSPRSKHSVSRLLTKSEPSFDAKLRLLRRSAHHG
uniref:Uncharacterized protein n=1 Tax=Setaria italica TaxID=4555 RepID=K3Y0E2_SETIT